MLLQTSTRCNTLQLRPTLMNHVKLFKGQPRLFALWELVPNRYKSLPLDHFGQAAMNDSTKLSNKTSTA